MGFIQVISGFFSYVMVLAKNGFYPRQLIGIRNEWENEELNDLQDGFGQEWVSLIWCSIYFRITLTAFSLIELLHSDVPSAQDTREALIHDLLCVGDRHQNLYSVGMQDQEAVHFEPRNAVS